MKPFEDPVLSIVIPCFNESRALQALRAALEPEIERAVGDDYEIVLVDDGSRDDTAARMRDWRSLNPRVVIATLSRNFGKEAALSCGLHVARGKAVIAMDADLQDPPELIPRLVDAWRDGADIVLARRRTRGGDGTVKRATAGAFYRLMSWLAESMVPPQVGDFRLLDRRAVDALAQFPERARFMKGLMNFSGFKSAFVDFDRPARKSGTSHWGLWRLWNLALDGITSFSSMPLRVWSYLGTLSALVGMSYAAWIVVRTLIWGVDLPGYASLVTMILVFGGLQLISIGILGEYIGRVLVEVKRRPLYVVEEFAGLPEEWLAQRRGQIASDPIWPSRNDRTRRE